MQDAPMMEGQIKLEQQCLLRWQEGSDRDLQRHSDDMCLQIIADEKGALMFTGKDIHMTNKE